MQIKKLALTALMTCILSSPALAAEKYEYYLKYQDVADSYQLLPPPPAYDSIDFLSDKAHYDKGKALRNTPRGKQAYEDADTKHSLGENFSEAFGMTISAEKTPIIMRLINTVRMDAGGHATEAAKKYYNRIRPYAFFKEPTCRPEDEKELSTNGSYPSGHTAIGWAVALVLAEINPARQNEILQRGYQMGESRIICGYHWKSDIDAARVVASAVVATHHSNQDFIDQLAKAKAEFNQQLKAAK